ncbi:MAG: GxxExxY protein [Isosphaeraceae bacterium]
MDRDQIPGRIIGCVMNVSNALRVGFLENVYENAMIIELREAGLFAEQQKALKVYYCEQLVGEYAADILVEGSIILELKVAQAISQIHQAQLLNYLRATSFDLGLILNFGTPRLGIKRMVL